MVLGAFRSAACEAFQALDFRLLKPINSV